MDNYKYYTPGSVWAVAVSKPATPNVAIHTTASNSDEIGFRTDLYIRLLRGSCEFDGRLNFRGYEGEPFMHSPLLYVVQRRALTTSHVLLQN